MRWLGWAGAALAAALAIGAWLFPLSLALKIAEAPIEGTPSGTVWNGRVDDAAAQGIPLGAVEVGTRFLPLLTGRIVADLKVEGPSGTGEGTAAADGGVIALSDIDAVLPLAPHQLQGPFGVAMTGHVTVAGDAVFGPAGCLSADLAVRTDALDAGLARLGQAGMALAGPSTCEDGVLVAALTGEGAAGSADLTLRLRPRIYTAEMILSPKDARAGALLTRYGFRPAGGAYTMVSRGTW